MRPKWTLSPWLVLAVCLFYCADPMGLFWPFLGACFFHELGHAAAIWAFGRQIAAVHLGFLGAVIQTQTLSYFQEVVCALAGPAVNLACGCLFRTAAADFAALSLLLALFNLLPLYPLDGGRALQAMLRQWLAERACRLVLAACRVVFCSVLVGLAVWASCIRHYGLWPAVMAAVVLVKLDDAARQEK